MLRQIISNGASDAAVKGDGKKIRYFFGQRPSSDMIYTHQEDFFPMAEKKIVEDAATVRQGIFDGNTISANKFTAFSGDVGGGRLGGTSSAHPPTPPSGNQFFESPGMEAAVSNSSSNATAIGDPGYGTQRRNFFGRRLPSDVIYTHQQDFFHKAEKEVLERTVTARRSMIHEDSSRRICFDDSVVAHNRKPSQHSASAISNIAKS
ncbi:hypothetical protein FRB99_000923 [Tulasnella sp. 403]|nr:hypothetical protein FRB99_000923 [Tulasnella sp. 403]